MVDAQVRRLACLDDADGRVQSGVVMKINLLGPMEVRTGGRVVDVGGPRQRLVLAALAADVGCPVPMQVLIDRVWADAPPDSARHTLHAYAARLRRVLDHGGDTVPGRLALRGGGYVLNLAPEQVDLHRFRQLVKQARTTGHDRTERIALLRQALDLWRGEPLADLTGPWAAGLREQLTRRRLDTAVSWAHEELCRGDAGTVIDELTVLTRDHPLAEMLTLVLMRALYAAGQVADALACYNTLRNSLVGELGCDPGPEVQQTHQAILRGELQVGATGKGPLPAPGLRRPPVSHPVTPAQLPADVAGFTGRGAELAHLDTLLAAASSATKGPTALMISAVSGTAGVGKTALAVHWAHRVADQFPDGQLYVNLRGYDPDQPMSAGDALAGFLTALGVPGPDVPLEVDERAAAYRTQIAGRRMLVVLDNAASVEQVRPILPGTGSCAVVVTSRDSLAGLVARDGAQRLDLDLLPLPDAIALLRRLIGPRVDADPEAAVALAARCARLPLALRVAAELAASRPATPLGNVVEELADQPRRLELLDADGDPRAAVAAVFSWSLRHLPRETARTFRLMGLHPGPDLDAYAAAALADTDIEQARRTVDLLARAHLIHPTGAGRYGMHDLLRAYATRLSAAQDGDEQRAVALGRLFDYYLATAAAAMDRLHPAEAHLRPSIPPASTPTPDLADPDTAHEWLDIERRCLAAAATHGRSTHTAQLSTILYRYLDGGHYTEALSIHAHARDAAQRAGDQAGTAHALLGLGVVHHRLGRYGPAAEHLQQALALFRQVGDEVAQARVLSGLGAVEQRLGRHGPAAEHHERALALFRRAGDQAGEARALNNLGLVERRLGRYGPAGEHHERALALFREAGHSTGEAIALTSLGLVDERLGRHRRAAERHRRAVTLFRRLGDQSGEAGALSNLGTVHTCLGRPEQAADYFQLALTLFRRIGERDGEAIVLNGLGEAAHAAADPAAALAHHTAALTIATDTGARDQQARAHTGLGHVHRSLADTDRARDHYAQALTRYTDLASPEGDDVRAHLASIDRPAGPRANEVSSSSPS
jgi:DNA-binding SARP family transcriptional activator/tetratricopeptide (TPR) repeat protein